MHSMSGEIYITETYVRVVHPFFLHSFSSNPFRSEHQEATQHTGEGIIENIETEV